MVKFTVKEVSILFSALTRMLPKPTFASYPNNINDYGERKSKLSRGI